VLLGIDLGTSSLRVAIVDEQGNILGLGQREYGITVAQPGWAEQDPNDWWQAAVVATRQALAQAGLVGDSVKAIGVSGQMHGTVLVGDNGKPLGHAVIWADSRSATQAEQLNDSIGLDRLAAIAGNRVAPGFMAATLAWVSEWQPARLRLARWALLPKDYLRLCLTGEAAAEPSDASSTLLLDIHTGAWSAELCQAAAVDTRLLPALQPSAAVAGRLTALAAEEMGLVPGTPVVTGAADQAAQAVGNGVIGPDMASATVGTGGQLLQPCLQPQTEPSLRLHCFCHAVPGTWYLMAAMLSAGLSLRWLRDTLEMQGAGAYAALDLEAETAGTGAQGLLFLPYLLGERTPHMDADARGAFVGLRLRHRRGHLARSIMEGVAFALRDGLSIVSGLVPSPATLVASGGGARSGLWRQILADVFGLPLTMVEGEERAVVGAAMLAGIGLGTFADYAQARDACVRYIAAIAPRYDLSEVYDRLYALYRGAYPALSQQMHELSRIERLTPSLPPDQGVAR
jgi:xylulokinase